MPGKKQDHKRTVNALSGDVLRERIAFLWFIRLVLANESQAASLAKINLNLKAIAESLKKHATQFSITPGYEKIEPKEGD